MMLFTHPHLIPGRLQVVRQWVKRCPWTPTLLMEKSTSMTPLKNRKEIIITFNNLHLQLTILTIYITVFHSIYIVWPCIPVAVKATVILTHSLDGHEISVTLGWVIPMNAITTNCKPIWPTQDYMQTHTPTCMHACNTCTHTSYSMRVT